MNALVAADLVLIPCDPSPLAVNGVDALIGTVSTIANRLNPNIDILGLLLTRLDGRNITLNNAVKAQLEAAYGEVLLPVEIGINNALSKAQHAGYDVFEYDPACRGAIQYEALAGVVADALVLAENLRKDLSQADRYVATSRAKHLLTVVSIEN